MQVNIKNLIDHTQCYETVRGLRWPDGVKCPFCDSERVIKRGFDDKEPAKQRYECKNCPKRFDDLTDTIEGFRSLLRSWLRPHRGISQEKLPLYLGFFEFIHN